jgi:ketosteroid isomerase-like protein
LTTRHDPFMPSADVDALRRGYEALNRGDLSGVRALLHPDIEWEEGPGAPEAGVHHGREAFEAFLRAWLESFDDFRIEPEDVIERGDRLIALVRQSGTGRASGIEVEARIAHVWTVTDGYAVRWQSYASQEEALAAAP